MKILDSAQISICSTFMLSFVAFLPVVLGQVSRNLSPKLIDRKVQFPFSDKLFVLPRFSNASAWNTSHIPVDFLEDRPTVVWNTKAEKLYTIMMFEPLNANVPETPWLHWLVVDVPGSHPYQGNTVADYVPPQPEMSSGVHQYIVAVVEQSIPVPSTNSFVSEFYGETLQQGSKNYKPNFRGGFDVQVLANFQNSISGFSTFFTTRWRTGVEVDNEKGMREAVQTMARLGLDSEKIMHSPPWPVFLSRPTHVHSSRECVANLPIPFGRHEPSYWACKYQVRSCPGGVQGELIGAQDHRFYTHGTHKLVYHDHKYVCGPRQLPVNCVVYSLGSADEIAFEAAVHLMAPHCEVHVFDPFKYPSQDVADRYNFTVHQWAAGAVSKVHGSIKYMSINDIMHALGHDHVTLFKIDIEGAETEVLHQMEVDGLFAVIDQIQLETHSFAITHDVVELIHRHEFGIVEAHAFAECQHCIEFAFAKFPKSVDKMDDDVDTVWS